MTRRRPRRGPRAEPLLSFVSLGVEDLDRAVRFYRRTLGLPLLGRSRTMATFALGRTRLALVRRLDLARAAGLTSMRASTGRGHAAILLSRNVPRREQVRALLSRVKAGGGRIVRAAAEPAWGGEAGVFADPDSHLWEVAWNPRLSLAGSTRRRGRNRTDQKSN